VVRGLDPGPLPERRGLVGELLVAAPGFAEILPREVDDEIPAVAREAQARAIAADLRRSARLGVGDALAEERFLARELVPEHPVGDLREPVLRDEARGEAAAFEARIVGPYRRLEAPETLFRAAEADREPIPRRRRTDARPERERGERENAEPTRLRGLAPTGNGFQADLS